MAYRPEVQKVRVNLIPVESPEAILWEGSPTIVRKPGANYCHACQAEVSPFGEVWETVRVGWTEIGKDEETGEPKYAPKMQKVCFCVKHGGKAPNKSGMSKEEALMTFGRGKVKA